MPVTHLEFCYYVVLVFHPSNSLMVKCYSWGSRDSSSCINTHQEEAKATQQWVTAYGQSYSGWELVTYYSLHLNRIAHAGHHVQDTVLWFKHSDKHRPVLDWDVNLHPVHQPNCTCKGRQCAIKRSLQRFNLLKPTSHVMHQEFNIQQLYVLPTLYLCVLYLSENKQQLVPLTA